MIRYLIFTIALLTPGIALAQPQRIERNVARSKATLAEAIAEPGWRDGELVTTQGYASANDGGGNTYRLFRTGRSVLPVGTVDGGFYVAYGSDGYLKAVGQSVADIKKFGAVGDGSTDDTAKLTAAVATGKNVILPDRSTYKITTGVTLQAGQSLRAPNHATIKYTPDGAYGSAVTLLNGCSVDGVIFQGNGVATGDTGEVYTGAAVGGNSRENVLVKNCQFKDFVFDNTTACVVGFINCRGVNVSNNFFDRSNDNGTGISISYRVADAIISGNISYARFDIFAAISAIGGDPIDPPVGSGLKDTEHHIITNNIAVCGGGEPDATGREGLNIHYAGGSTYAVISGNVLVNWNRHGVYLRGDATSYTGPTIVSENIIRYCGGGSSGVGSDGYQYNSGIKCESTLPANIIDNIIEHAGYNTDGTERASSSSAGIELARGAARLTIRGNKVTTVKGPGICISPTVDFDTADPDIDMVDIDGNSVKGTTFGGITYSNNLSPNTLAVGPVTIRGNDVQLTATSGFGIGLLSTNIAGTDYQATITNNKIRGAGISDGQYGIAIGSGSEAVVTHNIVEDCSNGIGWRTVGIGSTSVRYPGHRKVGEQWWADFNQFKNCTNAFGSSGTGPQDQIVAGTNNRFQGVTNTFWGEPYYGSRTVAADRLGINTSGNQIFRFYMDAIPTGSAYYVGDRVMIRNPTAAGIKEYVCTTAGSPGTWTDVAELNLQVGDTPSWTYSTGIIVDRIIASDNAGGTEPQIQFPRDIVTGYYASSAIGHSVPYDDDTFDQVHWIDWINKELSDDNIGRRLVGNLLRWGNDPSGGFLRFSPSGSEIAIRHTILCYDANGDLIDNSGTQPVTSPDATFTYTPTASGLFWNSASNRSRIDLYFSSDVRSAAIFPSQTTIEAWTLEWFGSYAPVVLDANRNEAERTVYVPNDPNKGYGLLGNTFKDSASGQLYSVSNAGWFTEGVWTTGTAYRKYDHVHVGSSGTRTIWESTAASGTLSGATTPDNTALAVGDTFSDGTITWTYLGSYELAEVVAVGSLLNELSADPSDPSEGQSVIWQSDGTGSGDDGDLLAKVTAGGVTTTRKLIQPNAVFETLAGAVASTVLADNDLVQTEGYTTKGDGGGNTYIYHKTGRSIQPAEQQDDGGFYINGPGADDYLEAVDKSVVDVRKFGAIGSGDLTTALQNAADAAYSIAVQQGGAEGTTVYNQPVLLFPPTPDGAGYKITSTLTVKAGISIEMQDRLILDSVTAQTALVVGEPTVRNYNANLRLNVVRDGVLGSVDEDDIGARLYNNYYCNIYLENVFRFTTGFRLEGTNSRGFVYNTVHIGSIRTCHTGIDCYGGLSAGWCNQNLFLGGEFSGSFGGVATNTGIRMRSNSGSVTDLDNNTFFGLSFELNPASGSEATAIAIDGGTGNSFYNVRMESTGTFYQTSFTGESRENEVYVSAGGAIEAEGTDTSTRRTNFVDYQRNLWNRYGDTIFSIGDLGKKAVFYDGDTTVNVANCVVSAATSSRGLVAIEGITFTEDGVSTGTSRGVGRVVDTSVAKKFIVAADCDGTCSYWARCFDSSGNLLTPSGSDVYAYFPGAFTLGNLRSNSPISTSACITFADEVYSAEIYVSSATNLRGFGIKAFNRNRNSAASYVYYPQPAEGTPIAEVEPSSGAYTRGRTVLNADPDDGEPYGWVCVQTGEFSTATEPVFKSMAEIGDRQNLDYIEFSGSSNYELNNGGSPHVGATDDFEVEVRFFKEAGGVVQTIWSQSTGAAGGLELRISATEKIELLFRGQFQTASSLSVSINTWYVAKVTRVGSAFTVTIDDISYLTDTSSGSIEQTENIYGGGGSGGLEYFTGRMDYSIVTSNAVETFNRDFKTPVARSQVAIYEQSSDLVDPPEGQAYIWQSDGTGSGRDGDILAKVTAGGSTKQFLMKSFAPLFDHGTLASGTASFAFAENPYHTVEATGNIAITFSATHPGNYYGIAEQDGAGGHTITISTTVIGSAPTIGVGAGDKTLLPLFYDGTSWYWAN